MDVHLQVYSMCLISDQHYVLNMLTLPAALNSDPAVGTVSFNPERAGRALEG